MIVVPAKLGCSRGVMYDQIGVPREGCASFSDDGYPTADSSNFGAAANKKQRDVPRAFLRSATHEVTHTLNQIHQEQETSADNSIMTTTPSVADVLGGPATGEPGVFPDQIKLAHNTTVRHHLNHMPDPVIRPGGWPFASWFPTGAPQAADRHDFAPSELALTVTAAAERIALGQPLELSWTLTNTSGVSLRAPNDVSIEALFASITVTDGEGRERPVRPFVIICEHAKLSELEPGESVSASTKRVLEHGGLRVRAAGPLPRRRGGVVVGAGRARGRAERRRRVRRLPDERCRQPRGRLVMHPEVGKWVALGGEAYHLGEACRRLVALSQTATPAAASRAAALTRGAGDEAAAPRVLASFANLLPDPGRLAEMGLEPAADASAGTASRRSGTAAPRRAKPAAKAKGRPRRDR